MPFRHNPDDQHQEAAEESRQKLTEGEPGGNVCRILVPPEPEKSPDNDGFGDI